MIIDDTPKQLTVHLDKWLWAARFFKTTVLASSAVYNGDISYNGKKVTRPNMEVDIGNTVEIRQGNFVKTVTITGLSTRRKNNDDANSLFKELTVSGQTSYGKNRRHHTNRGGSGRAHPYQQRRPVEQNQSNGNSYNHPSCQQHSHENSQFSPTIQSEIQSEESTTKVTQVRYLRKSLNKKPHDKFNLEKRSYNISQKSSAKDPEYLDN